MPLHRHAAELLFQVIANCYERRSVAITTNLEFGQWNTVINDNRLTAALIDRLVHHGHVLAFTGESYRLRNALSQLWLTNPVPKLRCLEVYPGVRSPVAAAQYLSGIE